MTMNERAQYIGNQERGIPEYIFDPDFMGGPVETLSGRTLYCEVAPRLIRVGLRPGYDHMALFAAVDQNGVMRMNIRTRDTDTHEILAHDVFAQKIIKRFYRHVTEQGVEVEKIRGEWNRNSINYKSFKQHLDQISLTREVTPNDELAAATQTWTGTLSNSLGYGNAKILNDWRAQHKVRVDFNKGHPLPFENL